MSAAKPGSTIDLSSIPRAVLSVAATVVHNVERAVVGDARMRTARGNAWEAICADRDRAHRREEVRALVAALAATPPTRSRTAPLPAEGQPAPLSSADRAVAPPSGADTARRSPASPTAEPQPRRRAAAEPQARRRAAAGARANDRAAAEPQTRRRAAAASSSRRAADPASDRRAARRQPVS
jgi:hypothetical protein